MSFYDFQYYNFTVLPNGTFQVQFDGITRVASLCDLYETIANINIDAALKRGYHIEKNVPMTEAYVEQMKAEKLRKNVEEGRQRQIESKKKK